jgi:hypothetical protein|tara:strand:- start:3432 stop:3971 length:540 start_codon:yes stop_codon:yes gene_type:complete
MKGADIRNELEEKFNLKISDVYTSDFRTLEIKLIKIKKFIDGVENATKNVIVFANRVELAIEKNPEFAEKLVKSGWKEDMPVKDYMMNKIFTDAEMHRKELDGLSYLLTEILDDSYKGGICGMIMYGEERRNHKYRASNNPLLSLLLTKDFYENSDSSKKVEKYFSEINKKLLKIKNDK